MRYVCREFQTGNDETAIDELARIQDAIRRELHPIIVGGASYVEYVRARFARSTIVDSNPFMRAQYGRHAVIRDGRLCWDDDPWTPRRTLGALIRDNILVYGDYIANRYSDGRQTTMFDALDRAIRAREEARGRIAKPCEQAELVFLRPTRPCADNDLCEG